jgi:uncharacterized membrane protein YphA (DoxX/SURF4 family)
MKKFLILLAKKALFGLLFLVSALVIVGVLWVIAYVVGAGAEKINVAPNHPKGTAYTGMAFMFLAMAFAYLCVAIAGGVKWIINLWKEANE